jgi:O-antigen/teichoic acid export membrane protein
MITKFLSKYKNMSKPAKASLWFVFCSIVQKGISLLTTPIFTRILTTEEYGTVSVYNSWLSILTIFATLELASGVFNKAMIKYEDDREGYTSSTLVLATVISLIFFLIYILGHGFWNKLLDLNTPMMIMLFLEILFSEAMSFWTIRNRFEYEYRSVVFITLLANVGGTLLSVLLVLWNSQYRSEFRVLGTLIVHILIYSFVYIRIIKKGKTIIRTDYWKYALNYNLPLIPHYLSQQILNQSDRIMISQLIGKSSAAVYTVAYQIAIVLNIITSAIHASFSPWTFQCIKEKKYHDIGKITLSIETGIAVFCFLFSLFAPEVIYILGGEQYYSAIWVVPPVTMSIVFNVLYTMIANMAFYYEKTKFIMFGTLVAAVANIILNWVCIPVFGYVAAGYTTLACYIIYSIVHYIFMLYICKENNIPNPFNTFKIWGVAVLAVALSVVSSLLYGMTIIRYVVIIIVVMLAVVYRKKIQKLFTSRR